MEKETKTLLLRSAEGEIFFETPFETELRKTFSVPFGKSAEVERDPKL